MPPGSLEDLLIAEIALNQGDTKTAFERLDKQVKQTGDLRLALRAADRHPVRIRCQPAGGAAT